MSAMLIFKFVGSGLIIISSSVIGYVLALRYVKRAEELRALQVALQMLESEIVFSANPLPDALKKISECTPAGVSGLFQNCAQLLGQRTGITAKEAWTMSVYHVKKDMHLEKEDYDILIAFGNSLGSSDKENQVKNIRLACSKLSIEENKAEVLKGKNERLYKNLGFLGGILIALIFI